VRRIGIVPNSTAARTVNTTALKTLVGRASGFLQGRCIFPNTTGTDVYYFDDIVLLKDGVHLDLNGCTLSCSKTAAVSDDASGFLHLIRGVIIENGTIEVDYDPAGVSVNGCIPIYLGARGDNSAHITVYDSLLSSPMGNIVLRNLHVTANSSLGTAIAGVGGLRNVIGENITIDGQGVLQQGIYFEFGWATSGDAELRETSHPHNMHFRNVTVKDLSTASGGSGLAFGYHGCYNCTVDGLYVSGCAAAISGSPGESLFYRPWADVDDTGAGRTITVRNVVCGDATGTVISLAGAQASTGYLNPLSLGEEDETDLADYVLDGFALRGSAILCSARSVVIKNGAILEGGGSGALIMTAECSQWLVENVALLDGAASAIRVGDLGALWSPALNRPSVVSFSFWRRVTSCCK
jgi:hypothetical protein